MIEPQLTAGPSAKPRLEFVFLPPRRTARWWEIADAASVLAIVVAALLLFPPVPELLGLGWDARLIVVVVLCGAAVVTTFLAPETRGKRIRLDGEAVTVAFDDGGGYVLPWATVREVRVRRGRVRIRRTRAARRVRLFSRGERSPRDGAPSLRGDLEIGRLEWIRPGEREFLAAVAECAGGRPRPRPPTP